MFVSVVNVRAMPVFMHNRFVRVLVDVPAEEGHAFVSMVVVAIVMPVPVSVRDILVPVDVRMGIARA